MLSPECLHELQTAWLPHLTTPGLNRIIDLLQKGSPFLVHGSFTRILPTGCLATHAAWHHPRTAHLTVDAGINWLHFVVGLNPATSHVVRAWDGCDVDDWDLRQDLLAVFGAERQRRLQESAPPRFTNRLEGCVSQDRNAGSPPSRGPETRRPWLGIRQ